MFSLIIQFCRRQDTLFAHFEAAMLRERADRNEAELAAQEGRWAHSVDGGSAIDELRHVRSVMQSAMVAMALFNADPPPRACICCVLRPLTGPLLATLRSASIGEGIEEIRNDYHTLFQGLLDILNTSGQNLSFLTFRLDFNEFYHQAAVSEGDAAAAAVY